MTSWKTHSSTYSHVSAGKHFCNEYAFPDEKGGGLSCVKTYSEKLLCCGKAHLYAVSLTWQISCREAFECVFQEDSCLWSSLLPSSSSFAESVVHFKGVNGQKESDGETPSNLTAADIFIQRFNPSRWNWSCSNCGLSTQELFVKCYLSRHAA